MKCSSILFLIAFAGKKETHAGVQTVPTQEADGDVSYKDDDDDDDDKGKRSRSKKSRKKKERGDRDDIPDDLFHDEDEDGSNRPTESSISATTAQPTSLPSESFQAGPSSGSSSVSSQPTAMHRDTPAPSISTVAPTMQADSLPTFIVISPITIISPNSTIAPSISPVILESPGPSSIPPAIASSEEQRDCQLSDGTYGNTDDETLWREIVQYKYQIETVVGILEDMTLADVLVRLEHSMTERLIPTLFHGDCVGHRRFALETDTSSVMGLSAQPTDTIEPNEFCSSANGLCFVVNGQLTLYTTSEQLAVGEVVKRQMQQEIELGSFDALDPSITRVALYTKDSIAGQDEDASGTITIPPSGQKRSPLIGTLIGLFGTLAIFAFVLIRRQWGIRRNNSREAVALNRVA